MCYTESSCQLFIFRIFWWSWKIHVLTLFDMGIFWTVSYGGPWGSPHHNFVVIAPMIMKFDTGVKHDVFYTMVAKIFVESLLLRHYDVITCILADA